MEKYIVDYKNLINLIDTESDTAFKYQQIKAQERYLLEYIIFPEVENKFYRKLTTVAQFIYECMPVIQKQNRSVNVMFQMHSALQTLKIILNENTTDLDNLFEVDKFKQSFLEKNVYEEAL